MNALLNDLAPIDGRICADCIGEPYLKADVVMNGSKAQCTYCRKTGQTITLQQLAERLERVFKDHYQWISSPPPRDEFPEAYDDRSPYYYLSQGVPVAEIVEHAAKIGTGPAAHIQQLLDSRNYFEEGEITGEANPFGEDARYIAKSEDGHELSSNWLWFKYSLKTETRLFNTWGEQTLQEVFAGLSDHATIDGRPAIVDAGPGNELSALFRARVLPPEEEAITAAIERPDREIGPPPSQLARPGRMNARGISMFYGATDETVAIAEVRPPVGSRVAVARFKLARPLRLLDVQALESIYVTGSKFDPNFIRRLQRARFLAQLSREIAIPVMPSDDPADYLVTQAIADYLADRVQPPLDGIIYPSAQNIAAGLNVALFHRASLVQEIDIPTGTKISSKTERGGGDRTPAYIVWERIPSPHEKHDEPTKPCNWMDRREPTLRIDVKSVRIHHTEGVTVRTTPFPVTRHRKALQNRRP